VLREGKRQGARNMLVTHATSQYPGLSIEQLKQATELGAYLEFVWSGAQGVGLVHWIQAIRAATPQWVVISSDLGQPNNPLHTDGLQNLYRTLKAQGFSDAEIAQMSKTNPAKLLALAPVE